MPCRPSRLLPAFTLGVLACAEKSETRPPDATNETSEVETVSGEEARRAVVAAIGEHVVLPRYRTFAADVDALVSATAALESSEAATVDVASHALAAARSAWEQAIGTWQEAELFQIGPAGAAGQVAGGQGLRARIYSWPLTNPCRVDQEMVKGDLFDPTKLALAPANVRGLAALEYLLYAPDDVNACPGSSSINGDGSWAALSPEQVRQRRARYAATVAQDLKLAAVALRDAWEPAAGDFLGELAGASTRGTYGSVQDALNAISDGLIYLDKETKDMKLAGPLGLMGCASETCPQLVESRYAKRSAAHVVRNLVAFQHAFHGGPPGGDELGFDDLLIAAGADALAADITTKVAAALASAMAVPDPLEDTLASDYARVEAAHATMAELNRVMKTQLMSVLDLELPERAEGDND